MSRSLFCLGLAALLGTTQAAPAIQSSEGSTLLVRWRQNIDVKAAGEKAKVHGALSQKILRNLGKQEKISIVKTPPGDDKKILEKLKADSDVLWAELDQPRCPAGAPNDPVFYALWGLRNQGQVVGSVAGTPGADIKYLEARILGRTPTNPPIVAVIDTGVHYDLDDLAENMWTNRFEIPNNEIDDDENGYVDDCVGYNFAMNRASPKTQHTHGTHVAGIIAATANNNVGIAGVCPEARILGLCVVDDLGQTWTSSSIEAMDYCVGLKERGENIVVVNASFSGDAYSEAEKAAIDALAEAGIIVCAAAGNGGADSIGDDLDLTPEYPAAYGCSNIITVMATNNKDDLASFSNFGAATAHLGAPGVGIAASVPSISAGFIGAEQAMPAGTVTYSGMTDTWLEGTLYNCGLGYPADFPPEVVGQIALIQRGVLSFADKARNAMAAGAKAVVFYNNVAGALGATLGKPDNWVPAVGLQQADGVWLAERCPLAASLIVAYSPYSYCLGISGTSKAAPHVSGAVAWAAILHPEETMSQRRQRVLSAVDPLPSLVGKCTTEGRLNLLKIADADSDNAADWWELEHFATTENDGAADPDQDGYSTAQEFHANTDPLESDSRLSLKLECTVEGPKLTWQSGPDSLVRIERSMYPVGGWSVLVTNLPNNGVWIDDRFPWYQQSFYRIRAERQ